MKLNERIHNKWFFTETNIFLRFLTIFVKGDALIILPFLLFILLIGLFSVKFMLLMYLVFFTLRHFGEMIYWFFQQFYDKKHRPHDFGLKKLDNHAMYIIYQTMALAWTTLGISLILYLFSYLRP